MKAVVLLVVVACSSGDDAPPPRQRRPRDAGRVATNLPDPKPEPSGDLPVECGLYKALVTRMSRCEHLGPQRGLLERQFETSWKAWSALPEGDRAGVVAGCLAASDAVRAAIVYCGP